MEKISQRICLQELTEELGVKDYRSALQWLKKRNIPFKKQGRSYYVLRWHIDFSTYLEIAQDLKAKFPNNWSNIFQNSLDDVNMIKAVFEVLPPIYTAKVSRSNEGHKFFK